MTPRRRSSPSLLTTIALAGAVVVAGYAIVQDAWTARVTQVAYEEEPPSGGEWSCSACDALREAGYAAQEVNSCYESCHAEGWYKGEGEFEDDSQGGDGVVEEEDVDFSEDDGFIFVDEGEDEILEPEVFLHEGPSADDWEGWDPEALLDLDPEDFTEFYFDEEDLIDEEDLFESIDDVKEMAIEQLPEFCPEDLVEHFSGLIAGAGDMEALHVVFLQIEEECFGEGMGDLEEQMETDALIAFFGGLLGSDGGEEGLILRVARKINVEEIGNITALVSDGRELLTKINAACSAEARKNVLQAQVLEEEYDFGEEFEDGEFVFEAAAACEFSPLFLLMEEIGGLMMDAMDREPLEVQEEIEGWFRVLMEEAGLLDAGESEAHDEDYEFEF